jgi:putative glutamine amidotransferase
LAVCRGFQEVNVALGGSLHQAVQEVPGMLDHREDGSLELAGQYAPAHTLALQAGGLLANILQGASEITVNSLHGQGIDRLAAPLVAEAHAPDGLIEAFSHPGASFLLGVQWHPEWQFGQNPDSVNLLRAFGDACRARMGVSEKWIARAVP